MKLCIFGVLLLICAAPSNLVAKPKLVDYEGQGVKMRIPKGWKVTVQQQGTEGFIYLQESDKDDAAIIALITRNYEQGANPEAVLEQVFLLIGKDIEVIEAKLDEQSNTFFSISEMTSIETNIRAKVVAFAHVSQMNGVIIGILASPPKRFDKLGGLDLLISVVASIGRSTEGGTVMKQKDTIKVKHPKGKLSKKQFIQFLNQYRAMDPDDVYVFYKALASDQKSMLVPMMALSSDIQTRICRGSHTDFVPEIANVKYPCSQMFAWAQQAEQYGYQSNVDSNVNHERELLLILYRCEAGEIDKKTCQTFWNMQETVHQGDIETMRTINRNLDTCTTYYYEDGSYIGCW